MARSPGLFDINRIYTYMPRGRTGHSWFSSCSIPALAGGSKLWTCSSGPAPCVSGGALPLCHAYMISCQLSDRLKGCCSEVLWGTKEVQQVPL